MDKKRPRFLYPLSLSTWLALGMSAFVLLGSMALIIFFQHLTRLEEEVSLESLGQNNALFLDQSRLPHSQEMAERLGRVMGAELRFLPTTKDSLADGKARRRDHMIQVGFLLKNGGEVWFSRDIEQTGAKPFWVRSDTLTVLIGFVILTLVFALWLGRRVTQPLARLAASLPGIGGQDPLTGLPISGPWEIVSLAKTLRETHESILSEREMRRDAERLALLGKMAASLAHEVRNPVAAIHLHAQLLERTVSPNDKKSIALIVDEAGRIEALVSQWLGYAKPGPVIMTAVDLAALTSDSLRSLERQATHANVRIEAEIDPEWQDLPVRGDRDRLRQVFGNLLLNAIQAMPKGGTLRIRVLLGAVDFIDEGNGFSDTALKHFGEPFHSEREGGMGLGLAVSKEIIESHGAILTAENLLQGGARVRIVWPTSNTRHA